MKTEFNKGRATALYYEFGQNDMATTHEMVKWLTKVAYFLLARYMKDD